MELKKKKEKIYIFGGNIQMLEDTYLQSNSKFWKY